MSHLRGRSHGAGGQIDRASKPVRRRIRLTATLRSVIVIAVAVGLAYTLIATVLAGPPVVPDPLTTAGTYTLGPGNFTVISGNITGGDYIQGNYTAFSPPGIEISVAIYNSSEWSWFTNGTGSSGVQWNNTPSAQGAIVFAAPYTDMYYFVFTNPLPAASEITVQVYVATNVRVERRRGRRDSARPTGGGAASAGGENSVRRRYSGGTWSTR